VSEQQLHFILPRPCKSEGEIFQAHHRIVNAGQPKCHSFVLKAHSLVHEDRYTFRPKQICNQCSVGPVIMVPENRVNAVASSQSSQQLRARSCKLAFMGDVITCQSDNVRLEAIGGFDCTLNLIPARERSVMEIRKVNYAQTLESFWQATEKNWMTVDSKQKRFA
jgi:hypothetical protein